jgi:hypothetical protein
MPAEMNKGSDAVAQLDAHVADAAGALPALRDVDFGDARGLVALDAGEIDDEGAGLVAVHVVEHIGGPHAVEQRQNARLHVGDVGDLLGRACHGTVGRRRGFRLQFGNASAHDRRLQQPERTALGRRRAGSCEPGRRIGGGRIARGRAVHEGVAEFLPAQVAQGESRHFASPVM